MIVIRSNLATVTSVLIRDMGILIPPAGGAETFTDLSNIENAKESDDLKTLCTDSVYPGPPDPNTNTLILSDGVTDVESADVNEFLRTGINPSKPLREVVLLINTLVPIGTVVNIQTGAGGGPATVSGDSSIELPVAGSLFASSGVIVVTRNGQRLERGVGIGFGEAQWVSSTQLAFHRLLRPGDGIKVVSPLPPPV